MRSRLRNRQRAAWAARAQRTFGRAPPHTSPRRPHRSRRRSLRSQAPDEAPARPGSSGRAAPARPPRSRRPRARPSRIPTRTCRPPPTGIRSPRPAREASRRDGEHARRPRLRHGPHYTARGHRSSRCPRDRAPLRRPRRQSRRRRSLVWRETARHRAKTKGIPARRRPRTTTRPPSRTSVPAPRERSRLDRLHTNGAARSAVRQAPQH